MPLFQAGPQAGTQTTSRFAGAATVAQIAQAKAAQGLFANKLLPLIWRTVAAPYGDFKISLRQDLAIHRFADLDGADVEPTGRAPLEFSCRIPFLNGVSPAPSETWPAGNLFPAQFTQFFQACVDRSPAFLLHPFGRTYCVVSHCEVDLKSSTRDGVYVDVAWIETYEPDGSISPSVSAQTNVASAVQAGGDLDNLNATTPPGFLPALPAGTSFGDFARGLQGVFDQASLLEYTTVGKLNAVLAQVQNVINSITSPTVNSFTRVGSIQTSQGGASDVAAASQAVANWQATQALFQSLQAAQDSLAGLAANQSVASFKSAQAAAENAQTSVMLWQSVVAADTYIDSLAQVRASLLATGQQKSIFLPSTDTSFAMLAVEIPAPTGDLMNLNPGLLSKIVVPAGTPVYYYPANQAGAAPTTASASQVASGPPFGL